MANENVKDFSANVNQTVTETQLLQKIQAKVYELLTTGGEFAQPSEDNFFCWVTPGMPVQEDDFLFASEGLHGVVRSGNKVDSNEETELESTKIRNATLSRIRESINTNMNKTFEAQTKEISDAAKSKENFMYKLALAKKRVERYTTVVSDAEKEVSAAQSQYENALSNYNTASSGDNDDATKAAKEIKEEAKKSLDNAKTKLTTVKNQLLSLQNVLDQLLAMDEAKGISLESIDTSSVELAEDDDIHVSNTNSGVDNAVSAAAPALTPEEIEALRADDSYRKYMQAEDFANLVDFVPDLGNRVDNGGSTLTVMYNDGSLSDRYKYALRMSKVMHTELDDATKKKIKKFRGLLTKEVKKVNIVTDEETIVTEESEMVKMYNDKMAAYSDALIAYNEIKIAAQSGKNQEDVHRWALNGKAYYNKVKAAMNDWVNNGYKNEYEQISAFINQVMQRDMVMLKEEYKDTLEKSLLSGFGADFLWTTLSPANFAKSKGWSKFTFTSSDYNDVDEQKIKNHSVSVQVNAGLKIGKLGIGANVNHSNTKNTQNNTVKFDLSTFKMSFEVCQVQIVRPWFKSSFLTSNYWCFDDNNVITKGQMLSDGNNPPSGMLPAYPTSIIFIRNLVIDFGSESALKTFTHEYTQKDTKVGAYVSYGPFCLGTNVATSDGTNNDKRTNSYHENGTSLVVDGMQIIGYNCHVLGKSPNPNADIKDWV